ncbi:MAG: cupin domain-containing protein [Thermogutta sp.]
MKQERYHIVDFAQLPGVGCPCGRAYRALADTDLFPGTIHRTEISGAAQAHFHRRLTETYYILEADPDSIIELDGEVIPLHSGMCVVIPPGVVHRIMGHVVILNIVIPKFDPADEFLA